MYTFYYTDGTYQRYELTPEEFNQIIDLLTRPSVQPRIFYNDDQVLQLDQIRSIVRVKDEIPENQAYTPDISKEEREWIRTQEQAEALLKELGMSEKEDIDY